MFGKSRMGKDPLETHELEFFCQLLMLCSCKHGDESLPCLLIMFSSAELSTHSKLTKGRLHIFFVKTIFNKELQQAWEHVCMKPAQMEVLKMETMIMINARWPNGNSWPLTAEGAGTKEHWKDTGRTAGLDLCNAVSLNLKSKNESSRWAIQI